MSIVDFVRLSLFCFLLSCFPLFFDVVSFYALCFRLFRTAESISHLPGKLRRLMAESMRGKFYSKLILSELFII